MNLFKKLRLGGLAFAHSIADKLIDLNSIGAVEQQIRDIETALAKVEDGANGSQAELRGLRRTLKEKQARARVLDVAITEILSDDDPANDVAATSKQVELDTISAALPGLGEDLTEAEATVLELEQIVEVLKSQHVSMLAQFEKLRRVTHKADAKETATSALKSAREQLTKGASVDSVMDRVQARADKADAAFDRERGKIGKAPGKNDAIATAQARIAARKKALAGSGTTGTVAGAATPSA